LEAGVEEPRRIVERRALEEGHLHDLLVRLPGADVAVVRPDGRPAPLPLLDDVGNRLLDQGAQAGEQLAPPVAELRDPGVDQIRWRGHARDASRTRERSARRVAPYWTPMVG